MANVTPTPIPEINPVDVPKYNANKSSAFSASKNDGTMSISLSINNFQGSNLNNAVHEFILDVLNKEFPKST